jgi:hypothetical protein
MSLSLERATLSHENMHANLPRLVIVQSGNSVGSAPIAARMPALRSFNPVLHCYFFSQSDQLRRAIKPLPSPCCTCMTKQTIFVAGGRNRFGVAAFYASNSPCQ